MQWTIACQSWAESEITDSAPDPKPGSAPSADKNFLLRLELMLNTGTKCLAVAFILKTMPKLDHLGVLFQELHVEGSRCFKGAFR